MASSLPLFQFPAQHYSKSRLTFSPKFNGSASNFTIRCSSNGKQPESVDEGVKKVEKLLEEKRRAELSARIASGEFTVEQSGFSSLLKNGLSKLGVPKEFLEFFSRRTGDYPRIPEAKGSISAIRDEPFFMPLYELYLTYGGIFRLIFGPKSFLIVSDPSIAKHILKDNSKAYSKGILAEILDFVMGKGLIPADGEIWRVRRRAIVPALHQKYVAAMIGLFGKATDRLCKKLDVAATDGEDVEMESLFSRLTLDIIGKAVFNYDFDSLTVDTGIVEAVYTVLREAEDRSIAPIPVWDLPIWKDISPKLKKVNAALKLINDTLDNLIAICKEPSVMAKLQDEVDSVLGDRFPTIEDLKKLRYTTRVINESLRLYPQPPVLIRRSIEEDVVGGYPIKRGEDIFISVWNLHRCPNHWEEADRFNPERWPLDGPNPNETNQNFSYLPFGGGPRKCVGDMFATFENLVAVAMLVRRFDFQMALGAPPVKMTTGATIHTTEGLKMTVTRRTRPPIVPKLEMASLEVDVNSVSSERAKAEASTVRP
ncbi:protein LUTEIN DEFICIENT 5, chloroplastic isoform X2 [Solanum tuberosum]|uniref:protein LUTEIN DEFICIENT 5, chloroplastic isoform X2 n=1 Tax=Solanum tuberosum TaxID=4113 RepID=UPI00073A0B85|nr:PREDICTED: protein LUTEIN DEFICIENT 5, chloroplastic isoform X2 [Solanum tuberosum]